MLSTFALNWNECSASHPVISPPKSPWYPLGRRLDGPHSRFGHFKNKIGLLLLPGLKHWTLHTAA